MSAKTYNRAGGGIGLSGKLRRRDLLAQGAAGAGLALLSLFPYLSWLRKRAGGLESPVLFVYSFYFSERLGDDEVLKIKESFSPLFKKLVFFLKGQALEGRLDILTNQESLRGRRMVFLFKSQKDWERFYMQSFQEGKPFYSGCQRSVKRRARNGRLEIFQRHIFQGAA